MRRLVLGLISALSLIVGPVIQAQEETEIRPEIQQDSKVMRFEIRGVEPGTDSADYEGGVFYLGPGALRMDASGEDSETMASSLIYLRQDKSYMVLMHETEEAVTYDLEEFARYTEKNEALQEKLWERLAGAASQEEAEAMLELRRVRREAAIAKNKILKATLNLEKTDVTGEMDGHVWTLYREFAGETVTREYLVTPWDDLGITEETSEIFEETAYFAAQKKEISGGLSLAYDPFQHYDQFDGYPLVMRQLNADGSVVLDVKVTAIQAVDDPGDLFENPGYPEKGLSETVRVIN